MSNDLHEAITQILSAHQSSAWGCLCGWQYNALDDYSHFDHAATALIRELGLPPTWGRPSFENGNADD